MLAQTYDPFGSAALEQSNTLSKSFVGADGIEGDTGNGLLLMGARPYSPILGRFVAVDPVDGGSLNNYDYAGQDPINGYDLDGTMLQAEQAGYTNADIPFGGLDVGPTDGGELWLDPNHTWSDPKTIFVAPNGVTAPAPYDPSKEYTSDHDLLGDYHEVFNYASYVHDTCYGSYIESKASCDSLFYKLAVISCVGEPDAAFCRQNAAIAYDAVRALGWSHRKPRK